MESELFIESSTDRNLSKVLFLTILIDISPMANL